MFNMMKTAILMAAITALFMAIGGMIGGKAGMMLAFELTLDGDKATPFPTAARVGLKAYRAALERGVVLRPLGDVLYWMPPYCVDEEQLQLLADVTRHAIEDATACA
mgnify:CR=1 FL=1